MLTNTDLARWRRDAQRAAAQKQAIGRTIYFAELLNKAVCRWEPTNRRLAQWQCRYDQLCIDLEAYKRAPDSTL